MIIREMESYMVCPKCGYGFTYTTSHTREKLETIYKNLFKIHMGKCDHCEEGILTIREAKLKIDKVDAQRYTLRWQCSECKAEWTQFDSLTVGSGASIGRALEKLKSETVCPLCFVKNSSRMTKLQRIASPCFKQGVDIEKV